MIQRTKYWGWKGELARKRERVDQYDMEGGIGGGLNTALPYTTELELEICEYRRAALRYQKYERDLL